MNNFIDRIQEILQEERINKDALESAFVDSFEEWLELIKDSLEPNPDMQKLRISFAHFKSLV